MTAQDEQQKKIDAVTIGQIRSRFLKQLESEIDVLTKLIRQGYHERHRAESFLKDTIGETLTKLQNIEAMASTEVFFPAQKGNP